MSENIEYDRNSQEQWLKHYYYLRAAFSIVWVGAALTIGRDLPFVGQALLIIYPAWDALANFLDAARSGGLQKNRTQSINITVSLITTAFVVLFLAQSADRVIVVFGAWAILSGLLQLGTAVRRWKSYGAQWAMILSGAQSALAGTFFILQSAMPVAPTIAKVAGYAGIGAIYFMVSAVWMTISHARRRANEKAGPDAEAS